MRLGKYAAGGLLVVMLLQTGCQTPPSASGSLPSSSQTTQLGSGTPADQTPEADGRLYKISINSRTKLVFDSNGKEIPAEKQFDTIRDRVTNQPQCQKRTLTEDTGEDDEYGGPILRRTTALYDLDGQLLYDFAETDYVGGFGDFVIRRDPRGFMVEITQLPEGYHTELWNYKTGETVLDGVGNLLPMNEEGSRFLATNAYGYLMGVINREGEKISGFPPPEGYFYSTPWNGMIISDSQPFDYGGTAPRQSFLLTESLAPVASATGLTSKLGQYLQFQERERVWIVDAQGKEVFSAPEGDLINYFDGELAILSRRVPGENGRQNSFSSRLVKLDGTELATGYDILETTNQYNQETPAKHFIAKRGERIELLDREGKVTAGIEIPGVSSFYVIGDGLITCRTDTEGEALVNEKLELLIKPGRYEWIRLVSSWENDVRQDYELLDCAYYIVGDGGKDSSNAKIMRHDLLDHSMNKLVGGLTSIGDVGPDRLAAVRGFSAGLMDWQGNWIVQKSIFQNLNDDYDEWGIY